MGINGNRKNNNYANIFFTMWAGLFPTKGKRSSWTNTTYLVKIDIKPNLTFSISVYYAIEMCF